MTPDPLDRVRSIRDIPALIAYLRDELDWPIGAEDFDELTFEYEPEELGIDARTAARIEEIKQLRPLAAGQPWGVFFIRFEPKRLPVVVLRRILSQLVVRKRASAKKSDLATWNLHDLLFISNYGEGADRQITFAHFTQDAASGDLPTLKVLGWDDADTALHISHVHHELQEKLRWPEDEKDLDGWRERWSSAFTLRHRQVITTSKDLAGRLAALARLIRRRADQVLIVETERGPLRRLHKAFREALIHDLSEEDFADMYAQTIAYGLLAARLSRPMGIIAENVADMVPGTNPFLRDMLGTFLTIGGRKGKIDFDELGIQDVVDLLNSPDTRMEAIVRDFGNRTRQEDPVIHFYELFLAEYDKKMKVKRGVFYTPQPVVSYIVRSVHELLQTEFSLADGLADTTIWREMAIRNPAIKIPEGVSREEPFVQILDIATGTATFLVEVIDVIHKTMTDKWRREGRLELEFDSLWNEYVPKCLLPRLYGYELLMAPYAIAHMKIGLKLYETGYRFSSDERVHVYLTNALEPPQDFSDRLAFDAPALAHEARAVNAVKRNKRFTVVIGNPPYSKLSGNLGPAAVALVEPFRFVDGERIVEKGALALELNLQDDYVKFWGLLCARVLEAGVGVASYITNSRYLASPTLRGLRSYLRGHFSRGFFLDLGGQISERKSVGSVDENVFDIEQGVSIGVVVAHPGNGLIESVLYGRMTGEREDKYRLLGESNISDLTIAIPVAPLLFRFSRTIDELDEEFDAWPALDAVMPFNSGSIITSRDNLAIDFDRDVLLQKIERFAFSRRGDRSVEQEIGYSVKSKWDVEQCKEKIRAIKEHEQHVRTILYRPFDRRYIYYLPALLDTPSKPVCESIFGHENLVLLTPGVKTSSDFTHILVSREPSEKKACSHDRATQMFPLYSYGGSLLEPRVPNISKKMRENKDEKATFFYVYAILHSPLYRRRYGSALRDSYPRVPPVVKGRLFEELSSVGSELVALHLVEAPVQTGISIRHDKTNGWIYAYGTPPPVRVAFTGPAEPVVDKVGWSDDTVWIDAVKPKKGAADANLTGTIGFRGVPEEVWNFHIGGYQVCEKWLKDRKGRTLTAADLIHYHRIVVALHETIRLMAEIDRVIDAHGGWPGAFVGEK